MTDELVQWLVPEASDPEGLARAVELVRSLVSAEVQDAVVLDPDAARAEYERVVRHAALDLCTGLFDRYLVSLGRGSQLGAAGGPAEPLWRAVLELEERGLDLALPSLPEPGEAPAEVAARIRLAAECLGLSPGRLALWDARRSLAVHGPRAVLEELRGLVERADLDPGVQLAAHLEYGRAMLECGALARARAWADGVLDFASADRELRQLVGWVHVAAGDLDVAAELGVPAPRASLPPVVVAMGDAWPPAREVLGGGSPWDTGAAVGSAVWSGAGRADLGAAALVVVQLERWGRVVASELAPGLPAPDTEWVERQELVALDRSEPEARIIESGEVWVGFPDAEGDATSRRLARHLLTGGARVVVLVPLLEPGGTRTLGWLRLELEHYLVPDRARLERAAAEWVTRLGLARGTDLARPAASVHLAGLFDEALAGFGLGRRRWYGLVRDRGGALRVLASGGEAFAAPSMALELANECLETRRVALASELDGEVRSALAVPLSGGRFVVAVESNRRGDLGIAEVDGLVTGVRGDLRELGWRLELAAFADDHKTAYEEELSRDQPGLHICLSELERLGPGPLVLVGPAGSGKVTLGRLVAFQGGAIPEVRLAEGLNEAGLEALFEAPVGILRDVEALPLELRPVLLHALDVGRAEGLICTTRTGIMTLGARLEQVLGERRVDVPAVTARRDELPGLFEVALRRAAKRQGCLAPTLAECARPVVWRQPWTRGLHDVSQLARRLTPLAQGAHLTGRELVGLSAELGVELLVKLPTRGFDPQDLAQAIEGTRKKSGALHRGRAASLMGWDPDTLRAKLAALHME